MYLSQHLSVNFGAKIFTVSQEEHNRLDGSTFLALQKGSITLTYKDTGEKIMLRQGDVVLISNSRPFLCAPYSPNIIAGIQIDDSFLSGLLAPNQHFFCDSTKGARKNYRRLHQLLTRLCSAFYTEDSHYLMLSLLFELADLLRKNFVQTTDSSDISDSDLQQERIAAIRHYLETYYHQPISLDLLADKMFLTPQYLSKFIKKHLGCTFSHYLTHIRLEHAHTELVQTNDSITAIALNNGFPNIAAFNKAFRDSYGASPSTYRSQYREPAQWNASVSDSQPLLNRELLDVEPTVLEITTAFETPAPYTKPWCDTINIGSLADALKISFHDSFLEYQNQIPVKYVRFSDIFSEDIISWDEQAGEFSFSVLDEVLEFFYLANVIPFVELSYKPRRTHLNLDNPDYWEGIFVAEKEPDYYYRLLSALLCHCIQRFGVHYMSQWRFELWLKHGDRMLYPKSFEGYFEKYMNYYRIIKELLPKCTVGGCGFNMCGTLQHFQNFIKAAVKQEIPFDFITLYAFSYETQNFAAEDLKDSEGIISANPNHIHDTFVKYDSFLKSTPYHQIPVYITELGSSVALENYVVDSVFQAAFLCHNMLQLIPCCSNVAYLSFWDSSWDMSIPSSIYFPGSSLVGENGIPKPALHGYSFLARLGKNLISQGDNYIMTCNSSNRFQLLFYHYTHFNDAFCFNPWETIPMEHTYEIFRQEEPLPIHFSCRQFPPGRYKVVRYSLSRSYGSALDKNLRTLESSNTTASELINTLLNLKEDESRYFKQTSIPRQDIYYVTSGETLTLDVTLTPHEVVFYEFSRIF